MANDNIIQFPAGKVRKHPMAECENCPLNGWEHKYVPTQFPASGTAIEAVVVGQAPGKDEVVARIPFHGLSGQLMRRVLEKAGYNSDAIVYTNAIACRPPGDEIAKYEGALAACRPRLQAELQASGDTATPILATGKYGAMATVQLTEGNAAPKKLTITTARGTTREPVAGAPVQRTVHLAVHPAFVLRVPSELETFEADVHKMKHGRKYHYLQERPPYVMPKNAYQLAKELDKVPDNSWVAFDVETEGLRWYEAAGWGPYHAVLQLGLYWQPGEPAIIIDEQLYNQPLVKEILNEFFGRVRTAAQNGRFDLLHMHRDGLTDAKCDEDTMVMHFVLHENPPHGLKELADLYYHIGDYEGALVLKYFKGVKKSERNYRMVDPLDLAQYLAWDVAITWQLREDFEAALKREGQYEWPYKNLLAEAFPALLDTEKVGVAADGTYLAGAQVLIEQDEVTAANTLAALANRANFNPRSWQQVGSVLWDQMGFKPVPSKHYAERSTSIAALQAAGLIRLDLNNKFVSDIPFISGLLHARRLRKILGTYVRPILASLDERSRTHPHYLETAAETGRLSAKGPPIQTIPRSSGDYYGGMLRSAFTAGQEVELTELPLAAITLEGLEADKGPMLLPPEHTERLVQSSAGLVRLPGEQVNYRKDKVDWRLVKDTLAEPTPVDDAFRVGHEIFLPQYVRLRKRKLCIADYSQAEVRVWAHLTQDPYLLQIYREDRDLHNENAIRLYGKGYTKEQRTQMKNWVFSFMYGGDKYSFAAQAKLPLAEASAMVDDFGRLVPVAVYWRTLAWESAVKLGYSQTVFGRKRHYPIINKETKREVEHACWNFPVQSTASDLNLLSHSILYKKYGFKVVITMHDMLAVECWDDEIPYVANVMRRVMTGVGDQWVGSVPWRVDFDVDPVTGLIGVERWSKRPGDDERPDVRDILATEDEDEDVEMYAAA